jgi:hypothetical protein
MTTLNAQNESTLSLHVPFSSKAKTGRGSFPREGLSSKRHASSCLWSAFPVLVKPIPKGIDIGEVFWEQVGPLAAEHVAELTVQDPISFWGEVQSCRIC